MTVSVVVADDHAIVREGIAAIIGGNQSFAIVGETGNGLAVVPLVEKLRPQVLIIDVMMPGLGGLEVIRQVRSKSPDTRIVVLSMHANEAYVVEALAAGADAYVLKQSPTLELTEAVRTVLSGNRYLSAPLSDCLIDAYVVKTESLGLPTRDKLTVRMREVLHLVAEGQTNREIANALSISVRTVEKHRSNLMRKLNLKNYADLVRYAYEHGILPQGDHDD